MDSGILNNILPESSEFYIPSGNISIEKCDIEYLNDDDIILGSISLIIPTFLNYSLKRNSLKYVLRNIESSKSIKEIIIVIPQNDKDEHRYLSLKAKRNLVVKTVDVSNNRGKARNLGAENSNSEFLLFLDDDMVIQNWDKIDILLSYLIKNNYQVGAFSRRQYLKYPGIYLRDFESILSKWKKNCFAASDQIYDPIKFSSPYKTILFSFPGCFMLIRKETFLKLNGFNENFYGWGLEDADFALRAIKKHKILNLFNKFTPLLHLDHSVSPYKSEEHKNNYTKFKLNYNSLHLDIFCSKVIEGKDFVAPEMRNVSYAKPLLSVSDTFGIKLGGHQIIENYNNIINRRLEDGWVNKPEWIIIHGSRATGCSDFLSDYDILVLFHGGIIREFFVPNNISPEIEIEYSDIGKYEDISERFSAYPVSAPLELSKIACGKVLWGDLHLWDNWSKKILNSACQKGVLYWLIMSIGLELSVDKVGLFSDRYRRHLIDVLVYTDKIKFSPEIELLKVFSQKELKEFVITKMSIDIPNWESKLEKGNNLFDFQTPEFWKAINWLAKKKY